MQFLNRILVCQLMGIFIFGMLSAFAAVANETRPNQAELRYAIQKHFAPDISDKRLRKSLDYSETVLIKDVQQAYLHCVQTKLLPENMDISVYFIWKKEREQGLGRLGGRYVPEVKGICVNLTQYEMMSSLQRKQALTVLLAREGKVLLGTAKGESALVKSQKAQHNAYRATRQMYGKKSRETKKARLLNRVFSTLIQEQEQLCNLLGISMNQFKYLDYRDVVIKKRSVYLTVFNRINTKQMTRVACHVSGKMASLDNENSQKEKLRLNGRQSEEKLKGNMLDAAKGLFSEKQAGQEKIQKHAVKNIPKRSSKKVSKKLPPTKRMAVKGADAAGIQVRVAFLDATTRIIDVVDSEAVLMEQYALVDGKITPLDSKTGQPLDTPQVANVSMTDTGNTLKLEVVGGLGLTIQFNHQEQLVGVHGKMQKVHKQKSAIQFQKQHKGKHQFEGKKVQSIELPEHR